MNLIGAGEGGDVDGAGRSELGSEIEVGLGDLEFLDGVDRHVLRGGADGLIGDVEAVHFDAGGAAETSPEGNRGKALFGGIEVAAILDLNAGFELG